MPPLTPERLAEIKARCAKATKGPWRPGRSDMQSYHAATGEAFTNIYAGNKTEGPPKRPPITIASAYDETGNNKADAEFLAHARQDVPDLLAEVERLAAALADAERPELVRPSPLSSAFARCRGSMHVWTRASGARCSCGAVEVT